jgi:hypothetical protein
VSDEEEVVEAWIVGEHPLPHSRMPWEISDTAVGMLGRVVVHEGNEWTIYSYEAFDNLFEWIPANLRTNVDGRDV